MKIKLDTFRVASPNAIQIAFRDNEAAEAIAHHISMCAVVNVHRIGTLAMEISGPDVKATATEAMIGKAASIAAFTPERGKTAHSITWLSADPVTDEERIEKSIEWAKQQGKKSNG